MSTPLLPARTYNQNHVARKYTAGKRRLSIYWTWSYPWESQRDPAAMENRFSTMTEVRNVLWPEYETPEWIAAQFLQGIAGTLELFHRSTLAFQKAAGEVTGHPVAVFQRIDQAGYKLPIDERILADTDTLMVFGLDHLVSEQEATSGEIEAIREWLKRDGTCLPLDLDRPHPFTAAGNTEFNSCIWMPPNGQRAGHILLADSTIFTTLFGGVESLETFWKNLASMPLASGKQAKKTQAVA